jgi:hypothetical protein
MYAYIAITLVKLAILGSYGYIHPDEHMQSPEITAGIIFSPNSSSSSTLYITSQDG